MSKQNDQSISQKMTILNEKLAWFEGESFSLEEAIERYAEAEKLAKEIEHDLAELKNKIVVLKKDFSVEA